MDAATTAVSGLFYCCSSVAAVVTASDLTTTVVDANSSAKWGLSTRSLFYSIGNTVLHYSVNVTFPIEQKALRAGSHCGREELCR